MPIIHSLLKKIVAQGNTYGQTWLGAIAFYTCIPIPHHWALNFSGIARWAPVVGLVIGGSVGFLDLVLALLQMPILVRSVIIVASWVAITGGLHLDGAIDTADGLAVLDPQRRLEVMADSRTGAFGVMVAILILLLKSTALDSLTANRGWALMLAAGWGRWGQLIAIARYPYLKPQGKGAFHKDAIRSLWDVVPSLFLMVLISGFPFVADGKAGRAIVLILGCTLIALGTGAWFNKKLGGHTGDTYGAVVEWTETLILCGLTIPGSTPFML
ncbi:MAG: adenosylcobinamide-GDP ribazoletransferase [Leptolyngbyaceae cyanobacterium bins.302]|nr:adenosylcobinamide-GDP ribazoletransferase [Leptolyngbyaceae cyanobacterium bins.302]